MEGQIVVLAQFIQLAPQIHIDAAVVSQYLQGLDQLGLIFVGTSPSSYS